MKDRRILDSNRILQVETISSADAQILDHLQTTILVTPGGLRYQITRIKVKLYHVRKIHFMVLTRQNKLLGSVGMIRRDFRSMNFSNQMDAETVGK